eukprot:CAMPEP_0181311444 /NCGR_PEP_ID=MMETSP1101-20121128/13139_1 /TAXON_ID=46948 /ORGANISM="Rhodomonas abbreviata, Strain Caron Lab Isolate" /LENGTH=458 /DNA_ID=CAMNT_0023418173 /DNA_START=107 /DNA_END=1483 /DNA_ORIENTATION=-
MWKECALSLLVVACYTVGEAAAQKKKMMLTVGMAVTFETGQYCRTYKVPDPRYPKLQCEGYNCAAVSQHVNSVQCKAEGTNDMGDMSWRCTGEIPKGCHFGSVQVSCEGFDGLDSQYIVPGSCGLTYSLDCDRMDGAQSEEMALRAKIKRERAVQQELKFKRLAEIEGMEKANLCELAVAGALHQPGNEVELQEYGDWIKGTVTEVNCDGTYQFQPEYEGRVMSYVQESMLRTWVATIYKYNVEPIARGMQHRSGAAWTEADWLAERCGDPLCSGRGQCPQGRGHCICDELYYGPHCENKEWTREDIASAGVVGFVFFLYAFCCGNKTGPTERSGPTQRSGPRGCGHCNACAVHGNSAFFCTTPKREAGMPEIDHQAMDEKRMVLDKIKATQAKLRVARVQAKHDEERKAALDKYDTEMDQLQRDVANDTAQLGNAMQRVDHVLDRYEAVGYANTTMR